MSHTHLYLIITKIMSTMTPKTFTIIQDETLIFEFYVNFDKKMHEVWQRNAQIVLKLELNLIFHHNNDEGVI